MMMRPLPRNVLRSTFQIRRSSSTTSVNAFPRTVASLLYPSQDQDPGLEQGTESRSPVVTVNAWIRSVRRQKRVSFAHIGDGTTLTPLQAVLTKEQSEG